MGGKALKNTFTERKSTKEYLKIFNDIYNTLSDMLGDVTLTTHYHSKETHGDMDILLKITSNNKDIDIVKTIVKHFNPNEIINNGGVISFDYKKLQIDIIPINEKDWESAKFWYSYDPIPNLVGKTAHKFGLKFGPTGLVLPVRFAGRLFKDIIISKNSRKVFEFLGYDYDRYLKGFNTKQEIFDWVINSKFFDSEMFEMQNLNQIDRKRNRKRATYQEFLEYLKSNNIKKSYNFKDKEEYLERIDEYFPEVGLKSEIEKLQKLDNTKQEISKKFNGNIIMNRHNWLKGRELGDVMNRFKSNFKNFDEYVLNNNTEKIMKDFDTFLLK